MIEPKRYFQEPAWVESPMFAWIRWERENPGTALRVVVAVAAGHHARVVNPKYGVDRWMHIRDLLVPPDDMHTHEKLPEIMRDVMRGMKDKNDGS